MPPWASLGAFRGLCQDCLRQPTVRAPNRCQKRLSNNSLHSTSTRCELRATDAAHWRPPLRPKRWLPPRPQWMPRRR
eukprot:3212578-Pyramimonas_sp.AAC.1